MSQRRLLVYLGIFVTGTLAVFGFAVFVIGILAEFFAQREAQRISANITPTIQLALAGLCVAALMFAVWFVLVGLLIARQTRALGSGYAEAYRLIEQFKFNEAIPLLERSLREGKETPDVLMLLTSAYAYTGQLARAQATADRAVQLFPNDPGSYVTLANGYRLQAAYDEAASALRAAVERAPDQPILWAELGFVQNLAGEEDAAIESFKHAATHAMPAMYGVRVHYHLAKMYQTAGDAAQALKAIARMMSARDGLDVWKSGLNALNGTTYGSSLRYEIAAIEQALADADAGNLG
ncbi:MAG TPA: tetratricopeptide repeat protein [Phototrophicaceae bacterium]|jgi:tetratricopeptide (TPR) repeat protein|nr:tetratricopeptide repeat protein [Phototrophicaceae bacterium]